MGYFGNEVTKKHNYKQYNLIINQSINKTVPAVAEKLNMTNFILVSPFGSYHRQTQFLAITTTYKSYYRSCTSNTPHE